MARLASVVAGDRVVEVGAGLGSLTLALIDQGADVLAIEADRRLAAILPDVLSEDSPDTEILSGPWGGGEDPLARAHGSLDRVVRVLHADAMKMDWSTLGADGRSPWTMVSNLPYNISTPLVLDLLRTAPSISRFVVLVQKEAGERLVAGPGSRSYGIPSVKVAYWATGRVLGEFSRNVFYPRPKVESVVLELRRRDHPAVSAEPEGLFELVSTAFGKRRKMLRTSLAGLVDEAGFTSAGVAPTLRPEQLGIEQWGALTDEAIGKRGDLGSS